MAVEPHIVPHFSAPEFMTGHAMHFPENVPESDVNSADGRAANDAVAVPEMLPIHHLPEMLDAAGILSDQQLGNVFNGANHGTRVPLQRGLAPAPQARLIRDDFDKNPVPHPRMADEGFDGGDFHDRGPLKLGTAIGMFPLATDSKLRGVMQDQVTAS